MAKIRVVTGYVPIENAHRSMEEYSALGEQLRGINAPLKAFYNIVADCWLFKEIAKLHAIPTHSVGDYPAKNTLQYHIVNHQKTEWLGAASLLDKDADVFVWVDYGIMHLPGVTPAVINAFLEKVKKDDLAIPGCWGREVPLNDNAVHWRFCGGLLVVPRPMLYRFDREFKDRTMRNVRLKMNVTWDVNDFARMEKYGSVPIRWYQADHNETMFTGYDK